MAASKEQTEKKSKREYGDGAIYRRTDGRYVAAYRPKPGVPKKYLYGKSESDVRRKLKAYKKSPEQMAITAPAQASTEAYISNWLSSYKKMSVRPATYDRIDSVARNHIIPALGDIPFGQLTADDCQDFINDLVDKNLAWSSIKKIYDTLGSCCNHAMKKGDIPNSPMLIVNLPSQSAFDNKDVRAFSEEEEEMIFHELDRKWQSSGKPVYIYKDAFVVMLNTGVRQGEMVALDWSDIDFVEKIMHIRKTVVLVRVRDKSGELLKKSTQIVQETPKTKSGCRDIPLNKNAEAALLRLKGQAYKSEFVLPSSSGERIISTALYKQFSRAVDRCSLPRAGVHTLRHTFATRLFERGADVKDVSVLLGHSSTAITYNTYIHVIKERKQDVVSLLD